MAVLDREELYRAKEGLQQDMMPVNIGAFLKVPKPEVKESPPEKQE